MVISKCTHSTINVGKRVSFGWMGLSSRKVIWELESDKVYQYFGILEANDT